MGGKAQSGPIDPSEPVPPVRRVLNAGSGPYAAKRLHPAFDRAIWREVRLDIDPTVKPDIVGSIVDLSALIPPASFDAVFSSHNLEHLFLHEVPQALQEFRRILKPDGFALITCPDLMQVARQVVDGRLESVAYESPVGPVTPLDMLFGHGRSIAEGNHFMAHHNGFTVDRLGRLLVEAGFSEAWVRAGLVYDLWAVALLPGTDARALEAMLRAVGLDFSERDGSPPQAPPKSPESSLPHRPVHALQKG